MTKRNIAVFAGAGVSTETDAVFSWTLYDEVRKELSLADGEKPAFPDLMERYCQRADGRRRLLEKIQQRFSYVGSFPELYGVATRFHRAISTLFHIDSYFTTNWDDYFERECSATPLVNASDFGFWDIKGRKVFKLHGSATNLGSLVITDQDYRKARRELTRGALGAALKMAIATKTIIYFGYSFSDHDFLSLHRYISREMGSTARTAYIVSLDRASERRFKDMGLTPIFTDATYFVELLKRHIETDGHFLPDARLGSIPSALRAARREHDALNKAFSAYKSPDAAYCAVYQDGIIHGFERMMSRVGSGQYSHKCDVERQLGAYESIRKWNMRNRRYLDAGYAAGYMSALVYLLADDRLRRQVPLYAVAGSVGDSRTLAGFRRATKLTRGSSLRMKAALARRVRELLGPNDELHHTPFLNQGQRSDL